MRMITKQPISATTRIWVDLRHQYGISWLIAQTSVFARGRPAEREQAAVYSGYTQSGLTWNSVVTGNTLIPCSCSARERVKYINVDSKILFVYTF